MSGGQRLMAGDTRGLFQGGVRSHLLISGGGADVFVIRADSGAHDIIQGFELGVDRIDLSGMSRFLR